MKVQGKNQLVSRDRQSRIEKNATGEAVYKTLHKIAVRSYKQPFGGTNLKREVF